MGFLVVNNFPTPMKIVHFNFNLKDCLLNRKTMNIEQLDVLFLAFYWLLDAYSNNLQPIL